MRPIVELFIRWIHFTAAIVWLGGIFFSVSVATPILRRHFQILESVQHATAIRNRLRHIIRFTIHILLITGAMNLFIVGLNTQMRFSQDYGYFVVFIVKLAFVGLMTLFHSLHIAVFNRRLESAVANPDFDDSTIAKIQGKVNLFGIFTILAGFVVFACALYLRQMIGA
jgi:putative copper export protein